MTQPGHGVGAEISPSRSLGRYTLSAIGLALLAWLLFRLDWQNLIHTLSSADPGWLGVALVATLLNLAVKAVRWKAMVRAGLGPDLSFSESFWMVPVGVAAGALTPARTVDLGKPALLVLRHKAPFGRAVMLAFWERLYDLAVLLLAGAVGAFLVAQVVSAWRWPAAVGTVVALLLVVLVASRDPLGRMARVVARLSPRLSAPLESMASVITTTATTAEGPPGAGAVRGQALALSAVAFLLELVRLQAVALALSFPGPWWAAPAVFSVGSLAGLLSLVPGGIGVSEWSQAALWTLLAPSFTGAAAVVMLDRLLSYYFLVLVGALLMAFFRTARPAEQELTPTRPEPSGKVWWVLPAYNEADNMGPLIRAIASTDLGRSASLVLVDDGSNDGTSEAASAEASRQGVELVVERHRVNSGLPDTLRDGLKVASGLAAPEDVVICLDADNTHHPRWAQSLLSAVDTGADVAICSRYQDGSEVKGVPAHRRVLSDGLNLLLRVFLPVRGVRDYTCGYRAYRARTLQHAFEQYGDDLITARSFACTAEVLLRLAGMGSSVREVPFVLRYDRKGGTSKMRVFHTISEYVRLIARARFARREKERQVVKPL